MAAPYLQPYRDTNNHTIKYATTNPPAHSPRSSTSTRPSRVTNPFATPSTSSITSERPSMPSCAPSHMTDNPCYDSDYEPLLHSLDVCSDVEEERLSQDDLQRFTATGRPLQTFKVSSMANNMYATPTLLPKRYTDDSIIPAIITDAIPSPCLPTSSHKSVAKASKLKSLIKGTGYQKQAKGKDNDTVLKVVFMPRRDYLKHFARGADGNYIGTEVYKRWTEEELEARFGGYRPKWDKKGWKK